MNRRYFLLFLFVLWVNGCSQTNTNSNPVSNSNSPANNPFAEYMKQADASLAELFKGVTTDGKVVPNLYEIKATGVSTDPVKQSAERFLAALTDEQRRKSSFPVDGDEWRKWSNIHRYVRQGVSFKEMSSEQRQLAFDLLRASLSAKGFAKAQDIMTLNEALAQITGKPDEYGKDFYYFTFMGTPSMTEPWGWQLDGHHLAINYFVLGDQVVMTPTFIGSEPAHATSGEYAGTRVFEAEEAKGLNFIRSLSKEQQQKTILADQIPREVFTTSFRDNFELRYEGINYSELTNEQRERLIDLIAEYINDIRPGHAQIKMDEVRKHSEQTYFAWMGGTGDDSVFYYRIHSPVVLIEFDHQSGQALGTNGATRNHIHTVIRTPNGNDYGKDLLRQHHEQHDHSKPHTH